MGLIVGTGCNATIPLSLSKLHSSKRPKQVPRLHDIGPAEDTKIAVNTEWTINGAALPLHELNFITKWDKTLDAECDAPGFQPFEYMTAGRYLGELGRIIITDYLTNTLQIPLSTLPPKLRHRHGITTTFLGNLGKQNSSQTEPSSVLRQLTAELPPADTTLEEEQDEAWTWTPRTANAVFRIAKAIQVRAAGMTAAAIIGLLACADEIDLSPVSPSSAKEDGIANHDVPLSAKGRAEIDELMIGYTGGCIVHFQDYVDDCQRFLDEIMERESRGVRAPRVVLQPCHDGGIIGAGILAGAVRSVGSGG